MANFISDFLQAFTFPFLLLAKLASTFMFKSLAFSAVYFVICYFGFTQWDAAIFAMPSNTTEHTIAIIARKLAACLLLLALVSAQYTLHEVFLTSDGAAFAAIAFSLTAIFGGNCAISSNRAYLKNQYGR